MFSGLKGSKLFIISIMGKRCLHLFSAVHDRIVFILAGNDYIHENLDEFEIRPIQLLVPMVGL